MSPTAASGLDRLSPIRFATHPSQYRHWRFSVEGTVGRLALDVQEDEGLRPGYVLKLNSYDLGVDLELADAICRLRFEYPAVRVLLLESARPGIFCAGANIMMLGSSSHGFKVNFCKFTNETRLYLEAMSRECGIRTVAAVSGPCAGGGYELAMACDEILLQDDGNTTVSLPEVPLLGVLPGTGGLTRLVDKRQVRRDLADVFATLAEGVKGRRAEAWRLVDRSIAGSQFRAALQRRVQELATAAGPRGRQAASAGVVLSPLEGEYDESGIRHRHVRLDIDGRVAKLHVRGPAEPPPPNAQAARQLGGDLWLLRLARELDDVLLDLRFNRPEIGTLLVTTEGDANLLLEHDGFVLGAAESDWFVFEALAAWKRTLKRFDVTARSAFALIEPGSCFAGSLFELALVADRSYMHDDRDGESRILLSPMNHGPLPMANGLTRLETRFLGEPASLEGARSNLGPYSATEAEAAGLVTLAPDEIDYEDEIRIAIEERASLSPDALTGMEANLRFAGPETLETKIFGRLSAWQNWVFQRPNATGKQGALTLYGRPERPVFDWSRT